MRSIHLTSSFVGTLVGVLVLGLGAPLAHAGGDASAGKAKSLACTACHVGVVPPADTPHLVGLRETYIVKQLKAFKAGKREHKVMNAIAGVLSEVDMENLAAYWASQPAGSDATLPEDAAAIKKSKMAFPKDFPKGFVVYKSENNAEKKAVGKDYINAVGFAAAKAGKPLPDGTIIMSVNYAAKLDASGQPVLEKDGSFAIDKVNAYEGMEARAGWGKDIPELVRNNNWNYAVFGPDKAPKTEVNQVICLACHIPAASNSFVFTMNKLHEKATGK